MGLTVVIDPNPPRSLYTKSHLFWAVINIPCSYCPVKTNSPSRDFPLVGNTLTNKVWKGRNSGQGCYKEMACSQYVQWNGIYTSIFNPKSECLPLFTSCWKLSRKGGQNVGSRIITTNVNTLGTSYGGFGIPTSHSQNGAVMIDYYFLHGSW